MDSRGINEDERGTMFRHGSGWRIVNALVDEVSAQSDQTGFIVVSYAVSGSEDRGDREDRRDRRDRTRTDLLRLNIDSNTTITNRYGRNIGLRAIRPGMRVDAEFSDAMTRSIPPQASAYHITVQSRIPDTEPSPAPSVTTGQITNIDYRNGYIIVRTRLELARVVRFNVTDRTEIFNRRGRRIPLRSLWRGQWIEVTHATFMTASIPPQTTAFRIQVL